METHPRPIAENVVTLCRLFVRVFVLSYFCAIVVEKILPGFVSNRIGLDFFLWTVIIIVACWFLARRIMARRTAEF